jgi:hypothetical protein
MVDSSFWSKSLARDVTRSVAPRLFVVATHEGQDCQQTMEDGTAAKERVSQSSDRMTLSETQQIVN